MPEYLDILVGAYDDTLARRAFLIEERERLHGLFDKALAHVESAEQWMEIESNRESRLHTIESEIRMLSKGATKIEHQMGAMS